MDRETLMIKADEIREKFETRWGPFTRSLAGHPKTALSIGFAAGVIVGGLVGRTIIGALLGFIGL